jgi:hypothetical protein
MGCQTTFDNCPRGLPSRISLLAVDPREINFKEVVRARIWKEDEMASKLGSTIGDFGRSQKDILASVRRFLNRDAGVASEKCLLRNHYGGIVAGVKT